MNVIAFVSVLDVISFERVYGWFTFGASAVAALGLLILVHEFGHFIVARATGIRVEKFSIGFGPRIFSKQWGDTNYMLSWIPLGGYVKFYGDDSEDATDDPESFLNQAVSKRLAIVAAGPLFNIMLAIFLVMGAAMIGLPEGSRVIDKVFDDSPASEAGLLAGDRIDFIDSQKMEKWEDIVLKIRENGGKEISLEVLRESGDRANIKVLPATREAKTIEGKTIRIGQVGISPREVIVTYSPGDAFMRGVTWTWNITKMTVWSVSKLIMRDISSDQIAGPIGIMQMAGKVAENGFVNLVLFLALISVNLGILNFLPIPVLDGGHIVFFTIEALIGKPVNIKFQERAQQVGVVLLLSLMVFAFYNDIVRLMNG